MISYDTSPYTGPDGSKGIATRSILIEYPQFRSEISWHTYQPWTRPYLHEWGPHWHELSLGKFTIDLSRGEES